jgi:hypothetical protein
MRSQKAKLRQEYIGFGGSETQARAASRRCLGMRAAWLV